MNDCRDCPDLVDLDRAKAEIKHLLYLQKDMDAMYTTLERQLAQRERECQDMETKLHNECQAHERTRQRLETALTTNLNGRK